MTDKHKQTTTIVSWENITSSKQKIKTGQNKTQR